MQTTSFQQRLYTLHYLYPATFRQYAPLIAADPDLEKLFLWSPQELAHLLQIQEKKAHSLYQKLHAFELEALLVHYEQQQIFPITIFDLVYPQSLRQLVDPPLVLYAKGKVEWLTSPKKLAIIGSRKATSYSYRVLQQIVPAALAANYVIVSGLARGADRWAHETTRDCKGKTIAVIGSGFSHSYPKENHSLAEQLMSEQLVLTEYPPYVRPARWTFPLRNRIISGLSEAVLVTESELKSGTMITVTHALENGKDIYAVPGPIDSTLSDGPNRLIDEGAIPVWRPKTIFL